MSDFTAVKKGVVKRKNKRHVGIFIDGVSLDRACKRLNKRVDIKRLVQGVSAGAKPVVARYYTLIPYEDDSRQHSFLDAVEKAGLEVILKRLPPKTVDKQVVIETEMSADIIAFAMGHLDFKSSDKNTGLGSQKSETDIIINKLQRGIMPGLGPQIKAPEPIVEEEPEETSSLTLSNAENDQNAKKIVTIICPSKELAYPVSLATHVGAETVSADFAKFKQRNSMTSAAKWIDLSTSETIWRED